MRRVPFISDFVMIERNRREKGKRVDKTRNVQDVEYSVSDKMGISRPGQCGLRVGKTR
jgi:hypothetical protein